MSFVLCNCGSTRVNVNLCKNYYSYTHLSVNDWTVFGYFQLRCDESNNIHSFLAMCVVVCSGTTFLWYAIHVHFVQMFQVLILYLMWYSEHRFNTGQYQMYICQNITCFYVQLCKYKHLWYNLVLNQKSNI